MNTQALRALFALTLLALAPLAHAADDALYRDLGEQAGIATLMADFVPRLKADPRIGHFFKDTSSKHLIKQLAGQVCEVAGGPCKLDAPSMKESHKAMQIGQGDFNALVEALQASMALQGVPFSTQNQLLARLAPMHRDIVNRP